LDNSNYNLHAACMYWLVGACNHMKRSSSCVSSCCPLTLAIHVQLFLWALYIASSIMQSSAADFLSDTIDPINVLCLQYI